MEPASARELVGDLFRRESVHLVAALARLLGPKNLPLAEDVVHDALVSAMQAWRFAVPDDPKAWILQVARNRAIDILRRERRRVALPAHEDELLLGTVEHALSPEADAENQLAMMFAICDETLGAETHVTLILRLLCGFSAPEIARAFLVDLGTIERRLHRGRARLQEVGVLQDLVTREAVAARQPSVEQALYLLFNEGYHGSDPELPLHPAVCADAVRLAELLAGAPSVDAGAAHALAALFCIHGARLPSRLDEGGVIVPLAEQDRTRWDQQLVARGIRHLGESAGGDRLTRWHLEAGIAFEHSRAPSFANTDWAKIVALYDALASVAPGPVVALNRALALAELRGPEAGQSALGAIAEPGKLAGYSFFWAAQAHVAHRAGDDAGARAHYARAAALARSPAEREGYARRLASLPAGSA
ncbi:MAG: polymerase sigma-70 factor, subfamily [Labilithrix sp.]|nr:polymerase sigma-70 factor, subfamily [Labilithrix sp.]